MPMASVIPSLSHWEKEDYAGLDQINPARLEAPECCHQRYFRVITPEDWFNHVLLRK
jgi:hypothetical protein